MLEEMLDLQSLGPEKLRPIKRAEYDRMVEAGLFVDERIELLDGFLVRMTPIGSPHSSAVDRLMHTFVVALDGGAHVRVQGPFAASDDSEPEPDVAVYPLGSYRREHPSQALLVIEVADSSLAIDRRVKAPLYARANVPEYWIVDVNDEAIEVYSDPREGRYQNVVRHQPGIASRRRRSRMCSSISRRCSRISSWARSVRRGSRRAGPARAAKPEWSPAFRLVFRARRGPRT